MLAALDQGVDDATRIDRIRALEQVKSAAAAAQARETARSLPPNVRPKPRPG